MQKRFRYPGAPPFSYEDRKLFFGRDDDINGFYKFINIEQLVVLYSQSGLGKSSLLNAGVVPKLREESQFEPYSVKFSSYGEEDSPLPTRAIINEITGKEKTTTFLDKITDADDSLWYHLKSRQIAHPGSDAFVLIFDQFENLFTFPDRNINLFGQQLADLMHIVIPQKYRDALESRLASDPGFLQESEIKQLYQPFLVHIVIAIRSDKMSLLNRLKGSLPNILNKTYLLSPLEREQAEDAIIYPALTKGEFLSPPFDYADDALQHMLKYLSKDGEQKIESFQLQILCQYIEENIVIGQDKKLVEKSDLGDIAAIFRNYYDDIISKLPEGEQYKARVFIEEGLIFEEEMRRLNVYEGQVYKKYELSKETLQELVNKRLLRAEPNPSGGFSYELSHDTLVAPILRAKARRKREEEQEALRQEEIQRQEAARLEAARNRRRRRVVGAIILTYLLLVTIGVVWLLNNQRTISEQNTALEEQFRKEEELNRSLKETLEELENKEAALSESNQQLQENAAMLQAQNEQLERTTSELQASERQLNRTVDDLKEAQNIANYNREMAERRFADLQRKLAEEFAGKAEMEAEEKSYNTAKLYALNAMLMSDYMDFGELSDLDYILTKNDYPVSRINTAYSQKVKDLVFSPDHSVFATISDGKPYVTLWKTATGSEFAVLTGHTDELTSLDFSPDGKNLAGATLNGELIVWNIADGEVVQRIQRPGSVFEIVRYQPGGNLLAAMISSPSGNRILIWKTPGFKLTDSIPGGISGSKALKFIRNRPVLAFVESDNSIRLYDLEKKLTTDKILKGHSDKVNCIAIDSRNNLLASGSDDNNIVIWDIETGIALTTLEDHGTNITSLQFSPERKLLASADNRSVIKIWSIDPQNLKSSKYQSERTMGTTSGGSEMSKDLLLTTLRNHSRRIASVNFLDQGRELISVAQGEWSIKKWDVRGLQSNRTYWSADTAVIRQRIQGVKDLFNLEISGSDVVVKKNSLEQHYENAENSYSFEEQVSIYKSLLEIQPEEYEALAALAGAYYNLNDYQNARKYYKRYLQKFSQNYIAWNYLGNSFYGEALYDSANYCYGQSSAINPDYYWAWYNQGLAFMELDSADAAIRNYNKAIEINPAANGVWNYLGNAYYYKGDYNAAIRQYRKEIQNDPDYKWAWFNLGQSYAQLGDTLKSIESYEITLSKDPNYKEAYKKLAEIYMARKDYPKSFGYYLQLVKLDTNDALNWFYLGNVAAQGGGDYVYEMFENSRRIQPVYEDYPEYWNPYGLAYFKNGNYQGAISRFQKAYDLDPENLVYASNLAMSYAHMGDNITAEKYFQTIIDQLSGLEPESELLDIRGFAYLNLRMNEEAFSDLKDVQKQNDKDFLVYRSLACYHAMEGNTGQSVSNLEKAYQLGYNDYLWLENEPMLKSIRGDAAFREIIAAMKAEKEQLRTEMQQQYSEYKYLQSADYYLNENNYPLAISNLEEALEIAPEDESIRSELAYTLDLYAESLINNQEYNAAYDTYMKLWETAPDYYYASDWNQAGNDFYDRNLYQQSIQPYRYAIKMDSTYKWAWANLGNAYWNVKDTIHAIEAFQASIAQDPGYAFALNGLGIIYEGMAENDKAIDYYRRAVQSDPGYKYAWSNLGSTYWRVGDTANAISAYEKSIDIDPSYTFSLNGLGIIYEAKTDYAKAERYYKSAITADPFYKFAWNNLGNLYWLTGKLPESKSAFKQVLTFEPENTFALDYLIFIYSQEEDWDSTVYFNLRKVEFYPNNANDWGNLSWYTVLNKQYEQALDASKKGLELDPSQRWILVNQAHAYLLIGDVENARRIYLEIQDEDWGEQKLRDSILQDFEALRAMGINPPEMAAIEQELTQQ